VVTQLEEPCQGLMPSDGLPGLQKGADACNCSGLEKLSRPLRTQHPGLVSARRACSPRAGDVEVE